MIRMANKKDLMKEYYQKNKERMIKNIRKWQDTHPEKVKQYREKRKDKQKQYYEEWIKKHPNWSRDWERERRKFLINLLGGKCQKCGYFTCLAALDFHHINPNKKERNDEWRKKGFETCISKGEIQLLCSNCHREKHNPDL